METRNCQKCKKVFDLTAQDLLLLEKMSMPLPTFCNACQFTDRMLWRNERTLYKRQNDAGEGLPELISIYSKDSKVKVFDSKTWWGDSWDAYEYQKDYDFSRPFFIQFEELIRDVPFPALQNWNAINSDYCNCTSDSKNCYMVFGGDFNEDSMYSMYNLFCKNVLDVYWVEHSEFCYESIVSERCHKVLYSEYTRDSTDSMFLYDCANCTNCIGCVSLRNKSYCILNQQYTKEGYQDKLKDLGLSSYSKREQFRKAFENLKQITPRKFSYLVKTQNCTGDRVTNSKDCINCFDITGPAENMKDSIISGWKASDVLRSSQVGYSSELIFNSFGVFSNAQKVMCSAYCPSSMDILYSYNCSNSKNLFGCVGLKNASYCILNKRYEKKEYFEMLEKITKHLDAMPYFDKNGFAYRFGDFFPGELSMFAYNESVAQDFVTLSCAEINEAGFKFYDRVSSNYKPTIESKDLPDVIPNETNYLEKEIIGCMNRGSSVYCTGAYRLTRAELEFYKRMNIPLPRSCFNCRHYDRFEKVRNFNLFKRQCMCDKHGHQHEDKCSVEFETSYAPDRPEIIYCEKCYQQEVY